MKLMIKFQLKIVRIVIIYDANYNEVIWWRRGKYSGGIWRKEWKKKREKNGRQVEKYEGKRGKRREGRRKGKNTSRILVLLVSDKEGNKEIKWEGECRRG